MPDLNHNVEQFNQEILKYVKDLDETAIVPFQQKVALEALKRIVLKNPVDTGRSRGNWQVTLIDPAEGFDPEKFDPTGQEAIQAGTAVIMALKEPSIIWISNNVNYVIYLEQGSSQQAPGGMVALTVAELNAMFP